MRNLWMQSLAEENVKGKDSAVWQDKRSVDKVDRRNSP